MRNHVSSCSVFRSLSGTFWCLSKCIGSRWPLDLYTNIDIYIHHFFVHFAIAIALFTGIQLKKGTIWLQGVPDSGKTYIMRSLVDSFICIGSTKKFARERPIPVSGYLHSLGDLNEWCSDNAVFPANEDVSYGSSSIFDDLSFRFSMSTYKLNWNGLALIVLGIVDIQKKFHPLLYACVSYETTDDYTQFRLWVIVKCHWSILREHFRANYTDCWWCDGNQECILQCLWFGGTRHHVIRSYHSQCSKEAICNEK